MSWERLRPFVRCHNVRFGATEFNPGQGLGGRFHPFQSSHGGIVPTLYAADRLEGALSETIFHNVPVRGPEKEIRRLLLEPLVLSTLACERDLTLVQLYGFGLSRLGISRSELIETGAAHYQRTAEWAQALHAADERIDGLVWVSRQYDDSYCIVLFGDRVSRSSLQVAKAPLPLYSGRGFHKVRSAAEQAGILIFD